MEQEFKIVVNKIGWFLELQPINPVLYYVDNGKTWILGY